MKLIKSGNKYVLHYNNTMAEFENEESLIGSKILPSDEVVYAIKQLKQNNHSIAQFGIIKGSFMFSENEQQKVKVWH